MSPFEGTVMRGGDPDREYVFALGTAVYAFARLEWAAIRCCEAVEPGASRR
jgi:hypothetical protein